MQRIRLVENEKPSNGVEALTTSNFDIPHTDPWEQLPNESDLWYDRFHQYLLLGPSRSMPECLRLAGASPQSVSSWYTTAKAYQWKARAHAYDIVQQENERSVLEKARLENKKKRIDYLDGLLDKLSKASRIDLDADMLTWQSIAGVTRAVIGELRAEYEPQTNRDTVGVNIEVNDNSNSAQNVLKAKILAIREKTMASEGFSSNDNTTK